MVSRPPGRFIGTFEIAIRRKRIGESLYASSFPRRKESRDRIIKATNSQTVVQMASLRATEKIHLTLRTTYDRWASTMTAEKNFYKNEGKTEGTDIQHQGLAQAVLAIVLWRPDTARARPSSLFKDEDSYSKVFDPNHLIGVYAVCATAMLQVGENPEVLQCEVDGQGQEQFALLCGDACHRTDDQEQETSRDGDREDRH